MTDPTELRERAARLEAERRERERERRERERERRQEKREQRAALRSRLQDLPVDALEKLAKDPLKSNDVPGRLTTRAAYFLPETSANSGEIQEAAGAILEARRAERARADGGSVQGNARVGFVSEISAVDLLILGGIGWALVR